MEASPVLMKDGTHHSVKGAINGMKNTRLTTKRTRVHVLTSLVAQSSDRKTHIRMQKAGTNIAR